MALAEARKPLDYSSYSVRDLIAIGKREKDLERKPTRLETIPLENVVTEQALVDDSHAEELGESMSTGRGQLAPIVVRARLTSTGVVLYDIIDGFHRAEGRKRKEGKEIEAKVLYGCSDEELFDQRILAASSVRSVQFPRVAEWVSKSWETTSWAKRGLTVTQAFVKVLDDREKTRLTSGVRLTPEELDQLKNWVRDKCKSWGRAVSGTYQILKLVSDADPDLVRQVRSSGGGVKDREGKITPTRLKVVVENFPGERNFIVQRAILRVIVEKRLSAEEAQQLTEEAKDWVHSRMSEETIYKIASQIKLAPVESRNPKPFKEKEAKSNGGVVYLRTPQTESRLLTQELRSLREDHLGEREPTDEEKTSTNGNNGEIPIPREEEQDSLKEKVEALRQKLREMEEGGVWWRDAVFLTETERNIMAQLIDQNRDLSNLATEMHLTEFQVFASVRSAFAKRRVRVEPLMRGERRDILLSLHKN